MQNSTRWRWLGLGVVLGALLASGFWIWIYDPTLLGLTPTVPNPVRPSEPAPGTVVVDPLGRAWSFDADPVPWAPILPLAQFSEAAYKQDEELITTLDKWGLKAVNEFPDNSMYAFVASNEKFVVVAFRGTNVDELKDWIADASILSDSVQHGRIHRGFYQSTQSLRERLFESAREHGAEKKLVWITGHSLGGAMALVFAYECLLEGKIQPAGVVTFGQPLVVNGSLARFLNDKLRGKYLRFVHGGDVVTRVFPTFSHCGNLVWFIHDGYEFHRPAIARSALEGVQEIPLDYGGGPQELDESEFLELSLKQEMLQPRSLDRGPQARDTRAPALLADHFMAGYLHWVVTMSAKEQVTPAPPDPSSASTK